MITNNFVLFSILAPQKQVASPVEVEPSDLFCVWRVYWWCTQTKDYCCFPTTDECDPLFTFNGPIGAHKLPVNLASCWGASHTKWMDGFSEATALLPQLWCSVLLASLTLLLRWRLPMAMRMCSLIFTTMWLSDCTEKPRLMSGRIPAHLGH